MNLIELYDSLTFPEGNDKLFNAVRISEYPNFRVAVDFEGNPLILLSVVNEGKINTLKNYKLKYLQLEQNIECKILENGKSSFHNFTVITFRNHDRNLKEYFLKISETLIQALSTHPTQQQVFDAINKYVEIFRSLTDAPTKTIQGLWAELFLIDNSIYPKILLDYWHNAPEEKYDFNAGREIIEVKSSSTFERIHNFTSEQLYSPKEIKVLIASIFVRQSNEGKNIQQLINSISSKLQNDVALTTKLYNIISRTLGESFEQSIKIKYDYDIAKESLQYYNREDIIKIDNNNIPYEVSEVRYKSDLSNIKAVKISELESKGSLFSSI